MAVIEPADTHYYQPLGTLVGGGRAPLAESARPEMRVMRKGVRWIRDAAVDAEKHELTIADRREGGGSAAQPYDFLHAVPPQSAPDWIKRTPWSTPPARRDMSRSTSSPSCTLGSPTSLRSVTPAALPIPKPAAIRKHAPVVVANLRAAMDPRELPARYDGYASCPIITSRTRMLLAESTTP